MDAEAGAENLVMAANEGGSASTSARSIAEAHQIERRQMEQWFSWMDGILDIHQCNFVYREPTPEQLVQHKQALRLAIKYCGLLYPWVADPDFGEPTLVRRLEIRLKQLRDAYNTFHSAEVSDAQAEQILEHVFRA